MTVLILFFIVIYSYYVQHTIFNIDTYNGSMRVPGHVLISWSLNSDTICFEQYLVIKT